MRVLLTGFVAFRWVFVQGQRYIHNLEGMFVVISTMNFSVSVSSVIDTGVKYRFWKLF